MANHPLFVEHAAKIAEPVAEPSPAFGELKKAMAARDIPKFTDPGALSKSVMTFVSDELKAAADAGKKPVVIILGEYHERSSSTVAALAAMKAVDLAHGPGAKILVEQPADALERLESNFLKPNFEPVRNAEPGSEAAIRFDGNLAEKLDHNRDDPAIPARHLAVRVDAAHRLGFDVAGFDTRHDDGKASKSREDAMIAAVRSHVEAGGAPAIVMTGAYHLPVLHEALGKDAHAISVSTFPEELFKKSTTDLELQRVRYLVDHPSIKLFNPTQQLELQPFKYLQLVDEMGIGRRTAQ